MPSERQDACQVRAQQVAIRAAGGAAAAGGRGAQWGRRARGGRCCWRRCGWTSRRGAPPRKPLGPRTYCRTCARPPLPRVTRAGKPAERRLLSQQTGCGGAAAAPLATSRQDRPRAAPALRLVSGPHALPRALPRRASRATSSANQWRRTDGHNRSMAAATTCRPASVALQHLNTPFPALGNGHEAAGARRLSKIGGDGGGGCGRGAPGGRGKGGGDADHVPDVLLALGAPDALLHPPAAARACHGIGVGGTVCCWPAVSAADRQRAALQAGQMCSADLSSIHGRWRRLAACRGWGSGSLGAPLGKQHPRGGGR